MTIIQTETTDMNATMIQNWYRIWKSKRKRQALLDKQNCHLSNMELTSCLNVYGCTRKLRKWEFSNFFSTDGVSVRMLMKAIQKGTKRKRDGNIPQRGLYAIDTLKHESRLELGQLQVLGLDPGKKDLLSLIDVDGTEDAKTHKRPRLRYSRAQRAFETNETKYSKRLQKEKTTDVKLAEQDLATTNSRSSSVLAVNANEKGSILPYIMKRRQHFDILSAFYGNELYRERKWSSYILRQKSMRKVVQAITKLKRDKDKTLVIAYGSWGEIAGKPGMACNKGNPPCIGIGLRKELAKHFIVASTPERNTSKTCSRCGSECGPATDLEKVRRETMLAQASTDKEIKKAKHYTIRGLRRCTNENCASFLHRDYNAAMGIGCRFKSIWNDTVAETEDDTDMDFERLNCALHT